MRVRSDPGADNRDERCRVANESGSHCPGRISEATIPERSSLPQLPQRQRRCSLGSIRGSGEISTWRIPPTGHRQSRSRRVPRRSAPGKPAVRRPPARPRASRRRAQEEQSGRADETERRRRVLVDQRRRAVVATGHITQCGDAMIGAGQQHLNHFESVNLGVSERSMCDFLVGAAPGQV